MEKFQLAILNVKLNEVKIIDEILGFIVCSLCDLGRTLYPIRSLDQISIELKVCDVTFFKKDVDLVV